MAKATSSNKNKVRTWILAAREEADSARRHRMHTNRNNYDMYHLKHDFSHKSEGQSREILSKVKMAVEQTKSFFQQSLADTGEWWRVEPADGSTGEGLIIKPHEIQIMTNYQLEKGDFLAHVGGLVWRSLLGALAISKPRGKMVAKPKFVVRKEGRGKSFKKHVQKIDEKTWRLEFNSLRQENYFPDPSGSDLYEIEESYPDLFEVKRLAEGKDAIYDKEAVDRIRPKIVAGDQELTNKERETGQDVEAPGHRPRVKLTEFYGTILDQETGDVLHENVICTLANEIEIIRKPTPNPFWHQQSPLIRSALLEIDGSVWHTALMDAPVRHNNSMIELYNLFVDAAMKQVHAISQLRKDFLDNPAQVSNGVKPGMTLMVTSALPAGAKVLESLVDTEIPNDAINIFNIMQQEFNASSLTNDLRQGVIPFRAVKATEVVEASQTITSVFQGMAKNFEAKQILPELERSWMLTAQNWDRISKEEFVALFGQQRGTELSQLDPQDVFVNTVNGVKFRVFGVTQILKKGKMFQNMSILLQTVSSSEILLEAFAQKYDFSKLLEEMVTALDISKHKIRHDVQPGAPGPEGGPSVADEGTQPDANSQIPQAASLGDVLGGSPVPTTEFPGSPATGAL